MNSPADDAVTTALQFLKNLPAEDKTPNPLPIGAAALALSQLNHADKTIEPAKELLQRISQVAAQHAPAAATASALAPAAQVAIIRDVLHLQFGFRGDMENYDDLQNCDFASVLERRVGLPVALCILAIHVGDALQLDVRGVGVPGHYLCALHSDAGEVLFDPFTECRLMDEAAVNALLDRVAGQHNGLQSLVPATRRETLVRLQNNRKTRLLRQQRYDEALIVQEAMLVLQPEQFTLWYEACLIATETNNYHSALRYLEQAMLLTEDSGLIANLGALHKNIKGNLN